MRLAAHLQSPLNIYSGKISTHKVIDTVPDEKYHLGQLGIAVSTSLFTNVHTYTRAHTHTTPPHTHAGVTVDTSLLRNWNPPDSSKMATVFVWVYKTGKCNATNFPLCVKTHTPPLQCAEELSDLLANTIYHAAECDPSILLTPEECNHEYLKERVRARERGHEPRRGNREGSRRLVDTKAVQPSVY